MQQRQSLPLEAKIIHTQNVIKQAYEYWDGAIYVGFSGGKDSDVLLDIVRELYPEVPGVFDDTGLEWEEIRDFVKQTKNIIRISPKLSFKQVIDKYGYPVISKEQASYIEEARNTKSEKLLNKRLNGVNGSGMISKKWQYLIDAPFKISDKCCDYLKKKPFLDFEKKTGLNPLIGVMAAESRQRQQQYIRAGGCNSFNSNRPISKPLSIWTEQDILQYIKIKKLPYASIYGDIIETENGLCTTGEPRTGCTFCMFGCHLEKSPNKFERMKLTHPQRYDYCINKLNLKQVLDYIHVPY